MTKNTTLDVSVPENVSEAGNVSAAIPPISLTEAAVTAIRAVFADHFPLPNTDEPYLRLYVSGGGCSGLQYSLGIDVSPIDDATESRFVQDGVPLVVDHATLAHTEGSVVDYVYTDDPINGIGGRFKVSNPKSVGGCGCGSSFRTAELGDEQTESGCGSCPSRG